MNKRYFYEANCRIYITAKNEDRAEQMIMNTDLNDFIIDEEIYEVDEDYLPTDSRLRKEKLGTIFHPSDVEEFQKFKMNKLRYSKLFDAFMHGQINKSQLMDKMDQADQVEIKDFGFDYEVSMVDFETKEAKTAKLSVVD
jgi:hypothetical protein